MINLGKTAYFKGIIMAAVLFMGVVGFSGIASAAAPASTIAVVDFDMLMSQHPDMAAAQQTLKAELEQAKKDYDEKSQTMANDEEKNAYRNQLEQRLNAKKSELFGDIQQKVIAAIKDVADAKGIAVVVDKGAAIYGSQDITVDVGKKLIAKK